MQGVETGFYIGSDKKLYAAGYNGGYQLGITDSTDDVLSWTYANMNNVKSVVAQRCATYVLTELNELYVIGKNDYGQLGTGFNTARASWTVSDTKQ